MVPGLFGRSAKSPSTRQQQSRPSTDATPPPPYNGHDPSHDHAAAVFATETTTTTRVVTTTTQTTHFFSLPLFRRRLHIDSTTLQPSAGHSSDMLSDDLGVLNSSQPPVVLLRDKELPPTPQLSDEAFRLRQSIGEPSHEPILVLDPQNSPARRGPSSEFIATLPSPTPHAILRPERSPSMDTPAHPTVTLARASLGLGLQPAMLNPEPSRANSSELNTVAFVPLSDPPTPPLSRSSTSVMRRAKSFHKDKDADVSSDQPPPDVRERRRTRGLSLGPMFATDSKRKEKQSESDPSEKPPLPKGLTRRPSFWSRMRRDSQHTPSPLSLPLPQEQPSLPSFQPGSPFYVDPSSSSSFSPGHSRQPSDLRRRHSERGPSSPVRSSNPSPLPKDTIVSPSPKPPAPSKRRVRRPQTADANEVIRSTSAFYPSPPSAFSSPSHVSLLSSPTDRPVPETSRPRSQTQTNPPLLHRLSLNIFGSSSSSHSPMLSDQSDLHLVESPTSSLSGSARRTVCKTGSQPSPRPSIEVPRPRHSEESPEVYLNRLMMAVSKAEVANVLASSADEFHTRALRSYIGQFELFRDPLDVALRRLLMDVGLPRETQQIDRVMEAFAARYVECHPNLFTSDDHPYILAFSLIMLHTDAFNKSNKRKMTKADYIKNTKLPGVPVEVLDCFYDNIVFAPFIFIEDPLDVNGQRGLAPPDITPSRRMSTYTTHSPGGSNNGGSTILGKSNKIDPYYLITNNLLDDLRVDVQSIVPMASPYVYLGTGGPWDEDELQHSFAMASVIEVRAPDSFYPAPWFSLGAGSGAGPIAIGAALPHSYPEQLESFSLKVTKVGLLMRKDDVMEGGRRAMNRKWKEWSVLLTGSQLLLSRDSSWANLIQARADPANGELSMPQPMIPKPDELLSVKDAVAVFDRSYTKYQNALRLVLPDGRQILLKAPNEHEMNAWISRINYASAFKTAGVRMRSLGMSGRDIELTGQAAAASHLRDLQYQNKTPPSPRVLNWGGRSSIDIDPSSRRSVAFSKAELSPTSISSMSSRLRSGSIDSGVDVPASPSIDHSARILKATFDQVKEELASGRWRSIDETSVRSFGRPRALSLESAIGVPSSKSLSKPKRHEREAKRISSRSKIIQSKIRELQSKIAIAQSQLDQDLRFIRNIAVLTPFQQATRERLRLAVLNVSKRVMQVRLDLEKLMCHRDVLAQDLLAEERDWQRTKKLALRAAAAKIRIEQEQERQERAQSSPRMTLSVYLDESDHRPTSPVASGSHETVDSPLRQGGSSTTESFHSAIDVRLEWPLSSPVHGSGSGATSGTPSSISSLPEGRASSSSHSLVDAPERSRAMTLTAERSFDSTSSVHGHEKYYTAAEAPQEQAEEWDKTRAAKRVSLVRLPSDLRMSALFGKHVPSSISEDTQTPDSPSARSTHSSATLDSSAVPPYTQSSTADGL
ncbi:hypothetical protein BXZ70DRAFT_893014 [Cristinia sonorae]|uniref:SEC7 domain-containing protein n=1 Tax=Cristinia sonorae TaxID=1940300 RepID=A0A8K0UN21_9AGAR|nr:hypothetical protein BXZ70DRAFT_893014 [Cristinia sonorae]